MLCYRIASPDVQKKFPNEESKAGKSASTHFAWQTPSASGSQEEALWLPRED
jgi:hypothetical protein